MPTHPLPHRPLDLCITVMPETPDGAAEVVVEARGRIVATTLAIPADQWEESEL